MTVSAIEFSRLGPPKLRLYAMRCTACNVLSPWWETPPLLRLGGSELVEEEKSRAQGELTNYTVVYYPPRTCLGQERVVGHITMDEALLGIAAQVVGVAPEDVVVGMRVGHPAPGMKLGHEGDIYSQKFVAEAAAPA